MELSKYSEYWKTHRGGPGGYMANIDNRSDLSQIDYLCDVIARLGISTVLDFGSGVGVVSNRIRQKCSIKKYIAVDITPALVDAYYLNTGQNARIIEGSEDLVKYGYKCDAVITTSVLMHIAPDDIQKVCDDLKQVAKKYIIISECVMTHKPLAQLNYIYDYNKLFSDWRLKQNKMFGNRVTFVFERV